MRIDGHTQLFGIIGNPVRHSLSPVIHNGAFLRAGINAVYLAFEVKSPEEAMKGIRGLGIRGVSVTMPFKGAVLSLLDEVTGVARDVQAVNTIGNEAGRLIGYNTDCLGAIEALEEKISLSGKRVLLLGAGGAARAIAFGLKERRCRLTISNRSIEKARGLAGELDAAFVPMPFSALDGLDAEVIVNASSVGMAPHVEESPVPRGLLRPEMAVMDIVYKPIKTRLLREAEEAGCRTIDGLEMLARQGAAQFQIWTGRTADLGEIKKDLLRALK